MITVEGQIQLLSLKRWLQINGSITLIILFLILLMQYQVNTRFNELDTLRMGQQKNKETIIENKNLSDENTDRLKRIDDWILRETSKKPDPK